MSPSECETKPSDSKRTMTIKSRLAILLAVTLSPILVLGLFFAGHFYDEYVLACRTPHFLEYNSYLTDLTHELQKERGLSAGFLSGKGKAFVRELKDQRRLTDKVLEAAPRRLKTVFRELELPTERYEGILATKRDLVRVRHSVDRMADPKVVVPFYTKTVRDMLAQTQVICNEFDSPATHKAMLAAQSLSMAKEYAGVERARVSQALARGFVLPEHRIQIAELRRAQAEQLNVCRNVYESEMTNMLSIVQESNESKLAGQISDYVLKSEGKLVEYTANEWWKAQTAKLGLYRKIQSELSSSIEGVAMAKKALSQRILRVGGAFLGLSFLAICSFGAMTIVLIARRTNSLVNSIMRIASGEVALTERLHERADELGQIAASFNMVMGRLQRAGDICSENSLSLSMQGEQVSRSALEVADQLQHSQSCSREITMTASSMNENIQDASKAIDSVTTSLGTTLQSIATMASDMQNAGEIATGASAQSEKASKVVERNSAKIAELTAAAKEIGDVVSLIQDIAEQTNLLSLNATIEAARAGDAGKGFAVVAQEVKQLASQTTDAIQSICERTESIQLAAEAANKSIVEISEAFHELSQSARILAQQANQHRETACSLNDDIQHVSEISSVARQKMEVSVDRTNSIHKQLELIENSLFKSASVVDETQNAGTHLLQTAENMRKSIVDIMNGSGNGKGNAPEQGSAVVSA